MSTLTPMTKQIRMKEEVNIGGYKRIELLKYISKRNQLAKTLDFLNEIFYVDIFFDESRNFFWEDRRWTLSYLRNYYFYIYTHHALFKRMYLNSGLQ